MAASSRQPGGFLLFALGLLIGLPLFLLGSLTLFGPPSIEAALFTIAILVFTSACLAAPWRRTRPLVLSALLLALGVVGYHFVAAGEGESVHASTGPNDGPVRISDRIVPERDVALGGSMLLMATGQMPSDRPGLLDALRDGYSRMRRAEGPVPSAVVSTFVFGQSPEDHSLLRITAARHQPPEAVVVFLHGFIGSVTLACWQLAQAATPLGLDVVCPATHWRARWADRDGREIVRHTIRSLRVQGVRRIYLAGLSAGAIGASRIAPSLDIEGVILVSGAASNARAPRVPSLVLQGALDRMTPAPPARAYARRARGRYEEHPDAGHWLILSHHEWFTERLRRWLAEREEEARRGGRR